MSRTCYLLLLCVVGCQKTAAPPPAEQPAPTTTATTSAGPTPASVQSDSDRLAAILKPIEWYVNDAIDDEKPRVVPAPIVRSRFEKKTEADFANLSRVLAETGIPVIIDLGSYEGTPATEAWLKHISGNRMVIGLRLTREKLDGKQVLAGVATMPWLELLELSSDGLTDADLAALAPLRKLKLLRFSGLHNRLTRASFAALAGLTELRQFDLRLDFFSPQAGATEPDYAVLAGLTNLETLSLKINTSHSTDAGLARLKTLTKLRSLALDGGYDKLSGPRTTEFFDAVAGMPELEELTLNFLAPSDGYAKLAGLKKLRRLAFYGKGLIGGEPLRNFSPHIGKITSLQEIDRGFNPDPWTDEALAGIRTLTNMRRLDLGASQVTDAGLQYLGEMKELTWLWCAATPVTGSGLKHLAGLSKLKVLNLNESQVTDEGLAAIPSLPELTVLDLGKTKVTDAGLRYLSKLPKLEALYMDGTAVTDAAVPTLKQLAVLRNLYATNTKMTPAGVADLSAGGKVKVKSDRK
jgi:internalin A